MGVVSNIGSLATVTGAALARVARMVAARRKVGLVRRMLGVEESNVEIVIGTGLVMCSVFVLRRLRIVLMVVALGYLRCREMKCILSNAG